MAEAREPDRPRGWWYPWIFVGGMLIVVAVNVTLVLLAVRTFSGLETTDHYRKGLAYEQALKAAAAQAERGWRLEVAFQPGPAGEGAHGGELAVLFKGPDGLPLERLEVEAHLIRPTQAGFDQTHVLEDKGSGRYRKAVSLPLPGQWDLRILARKDEARFQATQRLLVP